MRRILFACLLLTAACSDSPEWQEFARMNFVQTEDELAVDRHLMDYPQFIEFGDEFSGIQGKGIWAYGPTATIRIWAPADSFRIRLCFSTNPVLAEAGQELQLLVDGEPAGDPIKVERGWSIDTLSVQAPTLAVEGGSPHTITLRAAVYGNTSEETRLESKYPHAFFLKSLAIDALSGTRSWSRWREAVRANTPNSPAAEPAAAPLTVVEDTEWLVPSMSELPDIMFIVLDAARADHFSTYGYPRVTTPNIDVLSRDGLVFEQMFSSSAYTLTSTATLFTGHSWATHRLITPGSVLSDDFLTMSELLGLVGYWTLGISDNPNVSESTNLSQGFHEFIETWHAGKDISRRLNWCFDERLGRGIPENRPAFMYLHALPPHSPYTPEPEHDLWAPAGYAGDVDGSVEQLKVIHDQRVLPDDTDRERWISLYDANLHLADRIARGLMDSFQAMGRVRPLWIVVTSDHGEAFGEHGFYEHLSDVHDEMTHIPFVMWPADQLRDRVPALTTFMGNGDVLPMLLGALGLDELSGSFDNELRRIAPARVLREVLPMRSHESSHVFGLRSEEMMSIHVGHRGQFLYSLTDDPGQIRNLRRQRPADYSAWIGDLRSYTAALRPVTLLKATDYEPDEADLDALKALGYIE
jgi:arylsulfatase